MNGTTVSYVKLLLLSLAVLPGCAPSDDEIRERLWAIPGALSVKLDSKAASLVCHGEAVSKNLPDRPGYLDAFVYSLQSECKSIAEKQARARAAEISAKLEHERSQVALATASGSSSGAPAPSARSPSEPPPKRPKFRLTGCENGSLQVSDVNLWDRPGGLSAGARMVASLKGTGKPGRCDGDIVEVIETQSMSDRVFYRIKSTEGSAQGWITDSFKGRDIK